MLNFDLIKANISARAENFVHHLFGDDAKSAGVLKWRVGSHGSLAIGITDGDLVFFSHEDGVGGDAIALWHRARGGDKRDAARACAAWAGVDDHAHARPPTRPPLKKEKTIVSEPMSHFLTEVEQRACLQMVADLLYSPVRCALFAAARGWKNETVRALAQEGSLGRHDQKMAFIYQSGVKLRWEENGERMIRWHLGKPSLWRGEFLRVPDFGRVFLTEGETDAIRLFDAGAEADGVTLVVALPSASTFAPAWAEQFAGKDVTLAMDHDDAGQKATMRVGKLLHPIARRLSILNWKEIVRDEAA